VTELYLFVSTFVTVFALGFQSQNVNQGHYWAAAITSLFIGGASLVLYKLLPEATVPQCAAYLLGGVTGIVASMWAHRRWMRPSAERPR
jgi:uncharacterized BrkB/YihY/UPF0761 family membrane protein